MIESSVPDAGGHPPEAPPSPPAVPPSALFRLLGGKPGETLSAEALEGAQDHAGYERLALLSHARLGVASSLFTALRARDATTAHHSLRVALYCSSFAAALKLSPAERDVVEIAALLHDVGKVGVPDRILFKPSRLSDEEMEIMSWHRQLGLEILEGCCGSDTILETVKYASHWFDGSRPADADRVADQLPLASRIISIADAYDTMTTDRLYRRAMPRERAIAELFQHAATQFDPKLVPLFARLTNHVRADIEQVQAHRWLYELSPESTHAIWQLRRPLFLAGHRLPTQLLFCHRLLDTMRDGVVFVDLSGRVAFWSRGAERITGVEASAVHLQTWHPQLINLRDLEGNALRESACPVQQVLRSGTQSLRRLILERSDNNRVIVDVHSFPVLGEAGSRGVAVILHDASSESHLEEQVQDLNVRATRDPLTQVANRAEFDRQFEKQVTRHLITRLPCSLIICDIDRFKLINDIFGHQAGDEALQRFAAILKSFCRQSDLVARYGGEEFVIVCPECDNATATHRAEQMRLELARTPLPSLQGRAVTASFGVTELQMGDTPETMLRRADRALLAAKDDGRNRVVAVGGGPAEGQPPGGDPPAGPRHWLSWWRRKPPTVLAQRELICHMPGSLVSEKIRGFLADHQAEVLQADDQRVVLVVDATTDRMLRRKGDRPAPLVVEMDLEEVAAPADAPPGQRPTSTRVRVTIRPRRDRDRRSHSSGLADQLLQSLASYLMAAGP